MHFPMLLAASSHPHHPLYQSQPLDSHMGEGWDKPSWAQNHTNNWLFSVRSVLQIYEQLHMLRDKQYGEEKRSWHCFLRRRTRLKCSLNT